MARAYSSKAHFRGPETRTKKSMTLRYKEDKGQLVVTDIVWQTEYYGDLGEEGKKLMAEAAEDLRNVQASVDVHELMSMRFDNEDELFDEVLGRLRKTGATVIPAP